MVADRFPSAMGVDAAADQIADCTRRFAGVAGVGFALADALAAEEHTAAYDVVVCMEVLEHCPDDLQRGVLDAIRRVVAPGGLVVISVPIEIGPSVIAKQAARALAALRGLREYAHRERYRPDELVQMVFAGAGTRVARPETTALLEDGRTIRFTGHKGFNWKRLAVEIGARFHIGAVRYSPMPVFGAILNSQVWFVGTPRE
jgi:2-polyprenyl-3-methyl-5-hydroxy-6-metoxy-1,4-benzoquinol methylase